MKYTEATIFFRPGQLDGFAEQFESDYVDPETGWSAVHWDDTEHTRVREASISKGTIVPVPHYDAEIPQDPAEFTEEWKYDHYDGDTITCGWPDAFLEDVRNKRVKGAALLILALLQPMQAKK